MKKRILFFLFCTAFFLLKSQVVRLDQFGTEKNSQTINKALRYINSNYSSKKLHVQLLIQSGEYILTEPIMINKYISLKGEFESSTILKVQSAKHEAIIIVDSKNEKDIYNAYNSIENLKIIGPDYDKNPMEWKDLKRNNNKSVGVRVLGLRNKIKNCIIDGFLWSGIEVSSSYYNYITNNFIKNNRVGITVSNTSTSAYINNNELRYNSIGVLLNSNSYANFINNNMIESNINNMLENYIQDDFQNSEPQGTGVVVSNSSNNFISNNYFEMHNNNISLYNSNNNSIGSNFFGIIKNTIQQSIFRLAGKSENNTFTDNKTLASNSDVDDLFLRISNKNDYSTNSIDFGKIKNEKLKEKMKSYNSKLIPRIVESH